jgi:TRAP-type C4-dicarboxylate transport system permease large subunit
MILGCFPQRHQHRHADHGGGRADDPPGRHRRHWFGIFVVVVVEMAQITPPIGFNLLVLQGMTGHEINYVAQTALPFFALMCAMVVILIAFRQAATWLPETMRQAPG